MNGVRATSFACQIATFSALVGYLAPSVADAAPSFEPEAICRTAIASIMGRNPKIVRVTRIAGDIVFLSYVRPIDNSVWDYRSSAIRFNDVMHLDLLKSAVAVSTYARARKN
jgi:hypothetical protein